MTTAPPPTGPQTAARPVRWVMTGWREGKAPALTREQTAAALNTLLGASAHLGPCARCATTHHRYGAGGQPLCPACRTPPIPEP